MVVYVYTCQKVHGVKTGICVYLWTRDPNMAQGTCVLELVRCAYIVSGSTRAWRAGLCLLEACCGDWVGQSAPGAQACAYLSLFERGQRAPGLQVCASGVLLEGLWVGQGAPGAQVCASGVLLEGLWVGQHAPGAQVCASGALLGWLWVGQRAPGAQVCASGALLGWVVGGSTRAWRAHLCAPGARIERMRCFGIHDLSLWRHSRIIGFSYRPVCGGC